MNTQPKTVTTLDPYDLYDVRSLLSDEERMVQDTVARFTDERVLPVIGELKTWQLAFLLVSLPGPVLALLLLPMREPARHEKAKAVGGNP